MIVVVIGLMPKIEQASLSTSSVNGARKQGRRRSALPAMVGAARFATRTVVEVVLVTVTVL